MFNIDIRAHNKQRLEADLPSHSHQPRKLHRNTLSLSLSLQVSCGKAKRCLLIKRNLIELGLNSWDLKEKENDDIWKILLEKSYSYI